MFYTIYKITNKINGKIYIGKHQTKDLGDKYLGSGKWIRRAVNKYGIENFEKEILFVFNNEADMNAKELELVTEEFILQETNYNLNLGGKGSWSYLNLSSDNSANKKRSQLFKTDMIWAEQYRKKLSEAAKKRFENNGGRHSEETKKKISTANSGERNSQFAKRWITNDVDSKIISKKEKIPEGWKAGRVMQKRKDTYAFCVDSMAPPK